MKQTSGIKVKQDGGYGSRSSFLINGSTGKQVKFFIDGLPQDNLGETQGLNILPIEQTERIEVYKGILPVDLGADALGAAINIVTRKEKQNYLDVSYAISSFNTHRVNFLAKKYFSKSFYTNVQASLNYATNNYTVTAEVPNQFGNPEVNEVKRFHDVYKNYNLKAEAGFTGTKWADQLSLTFTYAGLYDQLQNNLVMTQPYGMASYKEQLFSSILKYQKNNLLKDLNLTAFVSYNKIKGLFTDTSKNIYNWNGAVVGRKFSGGEITSSANELNIYTDVINAKIITTYRINDDYKIIFSNTLQHYHRKGKDTVAQKFYGGIDYFGTPSSLLKNIAGIGIEGLLLKKKLRFTSSIKHLHAQIKGYQIDWTTIFASKQNVNDVTYNAALAFKLTKQLLLKASYEHAARLPDAEEAFGDLMLIKPNPKLQPEKSENINLNLLYNAGKIDAELTGFYRKVSNVIYLRPTQFTSTYQNLLRANVAGVEAAVRYYPFSSITLNGNITYQDMRNQSVIDNSGLNSDRYKNARIPNTPYFFMNGGIMFSKNELINEHSNFQAWYNASYTHEYFLYWEVDGARELKNRIPTQFLHYAGITYSLSKKGVAFTFEVNNITNQKTFDNFKVQLPGRAFSFKVRLYQFKNLLNQ
ncbi:MAG: TonB-dependent receptor [Ferruginibacter sp.]